MNPKITSVDQATVAGAYDTKYGTGAYVKATPQEKSLFQNDPTSLANFKNANPNLSFNSEDMGHYLGTPSGYQAPPVIGGNNLVPGSKPLNLPVSQYPTTAAGLQGMISSTYGSSIDQLQGGIDKYQNVNDYLSGQLGDVFGKIQTKPAESDRIYNEEGVDTKKTALDSINTQILGETNALNHTKQAIYTAPGITREQADQQFAEAQRQSLAKQADLAVVRYSASNDYSNAQAIADRKISMEFEGYQNELDALKFFYTENKDSLTKEQDKQFQLKIKEQDTSLNLAMDQAKTLQQTKLSTLKDAQENGAPIDVLTAIQAAKNPEEAQAAAGDWLGLWDRKYKQAQIDDIYSKSAAAGLDPSQVVAYAQQYASTGMIPTGLPKGIFGAVSQYAKELPKPQGTLVDINTGVKSGKFNATEEQGVNALFDLTKKLDDLKTVYGGTGILSSNADRQHFNNLKGEVVDLIARARTGAQINDQEAKLYESKLPELFNVGGLLHPVKILSGQYTSSVGSGKIDDLKSSLEGKLNTVLRSNGLSIYGYSTVNLGGQDYKVGDLVTNGVNTGRVNPDGSITLIPQ